MDVTHPGDVRRDGSSAGDASDEGQRMRRGLASLFGPAPGGEEGDQGRSPAMRSLVLVWLVFLAQPLSEMLGDHHTSTGHRVVVTVIVGIFALTFAVPALLPDRPERELSPRELTLIVGAMWVMIAIVVFYDRPSWDYEFIFSVFPAMRLFGCRMSTIAGLALLAGGVGLAGGLDLGDLAAVMLLVCGVGASMIGTFRLVETNVALRAAPADRARVAVAEERLRFARDLHDLLGHSLSVITLKSEVAGRTLDGDPTRAAVEIAEIQTIAREALREVREAVSGYRRATLAVEIAGARSALSAAAVDWQEDLPIVALPPRVESVLAWALREGVTNVVRHAGATACTLRLERDPQSAVVTVTDDGAGAPSPPSWGNGLEGLAERVAAERGCLEAGPLGGGGFRLRVSLPLGAA